MITDAEKTEFNIRANASMQEYSPIEVLGG